MILVRVESADLSAESPGTENGEAATETATESEIGIPHTKSEQVRVIRQDSTVLLSPNFSESAFNVYI